LYLLTAAIIERRQATQGKGIVWFATSARALYCDQLAAPADKAQWIGQLPEHNDLQQVARSEKDSIY